MRCFKDLPRKLCPQVSFSVLRREQFTHRSKTEKEVFPQQQQQTMITLKNEMY